MILMMRWAETRRMTTMISSFKRSSNISKGTASPRLLLLISSVNPIFYIPAGRLNTFCPLKMTYFLSLLVHLLSKILIMMCKWRLVYYNKVLPPNLTRFLLLLLPPPLLLLLILLLWTSFLLFLGVIYFPKDHFLLIFGFIYLFIYYFLKLMYFLTYFFFPSSID